MIWRLYTSTLKTVSFPNVTYCTLTSSGFSHVTFHQHLNIRGSHLYLNAMKRGIELCLLWGGNVESSDVPGITTHIYDISLALMTHKSTHIEVTLEQR